MEKIGIYKIINIINNKEYIGSSKNIINRFKIHKNKLNLNKHINIHLQKSWNKYGENNFIFKIIEECDIDKLLIIEQKYLNDIKNWNLTYNISKTSSGGNLIFNHPNKEKIINKITKILLEYNMNLPLSEKKKRSERMSGNKNINYGGKINNDKSIGKKISEGLINYYKKNDSYRKNKTFDELFPQEISNKLKKQLSKSAKNRIGNKNGFYGKNHTNEFKEKLSNFRKNKYYGKQNKPFYIDNVEYSSLGDASKDLDIHTTTIRYRLNSKNKKFDNYKYIC